MRLARHEGKTHPEAWVEIFDSHTRYEWELQIAMDTIEPVGDRRDDLRMGWLAAVIIASNSTEKKTPREMENIALSFASYLRIMNPHEDD
jgi:hypothetical protein